MVDKRFSFYEFFAGGGMARIGLGDQHWRCIFANEWCDKKSASYTARFGIGHPQACRELEVCDVADLKPTRLPGTPTLVWGSFPCQDLSLAGNGAGLKGERSGTFRPFWELTRKIIKEGRAPKFIVLENVVGALTSHGGADFTYLIRALVTEGYRVGVLVIDAVHFLPQSRPRLFIVGVHGGISIPSKLKQPDPLDPWHTQALKSAYAQLPDDLKAQWVWWKLPVPTEATEPFSKLIEDEPTGVAWHTKQQTDHIIKLMSPLHRQKLREAQLHERRIIGTVYRRMRPDENGAKVQRAEIRFDQIAGCLRTPAGGSSRQTIVVVEGKKVRSRLVSPREAARLMGVPDDYPLPPNYNEAYHLFGDGLAVPVVSWLSLHLLLPLATSAAAKMTFDVTAEDALHSASSRYS